MLEARAGAGVFSHAQIVEDQAYIAGELSHFLGDTANPFGFDEADGESAESSDVFGAVSGADAAAVLVIVPIDDVMATVFDTPVAAVGSEEALGVGLPGCFAGDAVGGFTGVSAGFFVCGFSLDDKGLTDVGEVEIAIEFGGGPDVAGFDPTVVRGSQIDKIRFLPIGKIQRDVLKKAWLVVFHGKVIMSVSAGDQVGCDPALGQEGIGGNFFSLDIDGIEQGDGGLDFVGTFDIFVVHRQEAYFFWV